MAYFLAVVITDEEIVTDLIVSLDHVRRAISIVPIGVHLSIPA